MKVALKALGIFILSFILKTPAFADEFVPPEEYSGVSSSVFQRIKESSVRFKLEKGHFCTGTWISQEGHLLTAFHCVAESLEQHYTEENPPFDVEDRLMSSAKERREIKILRLNKNSFHVRLPLLHQDPTKPSGLEARIVTAGFKGWLRGYDLPFLRANDPQVLQQLRSLGITGVGDNDDMVILKISRTQDPITYPAYVQWPPKCAAIDARRMDLHEELASLSFPTLERSSRYSPNAPLFTRGMILAGNEIEQELRTLLDEHYPRNEFIFNTLDAEGGSSGSGLFDFSGKLRGITIMTYGRSDRYYYGRTISLPVSRILPFLSEETRLALCKD